MLKENDIVEFEGVEYDARHGGAFDRGTADSYYGRGRCPHYYVGGTGTSPKVVITDTNSAEYQAYVAGYDWNEQFGSKKDWN